MTTLIALLISLLGYGTPADFEHMSEDELQYEISVAEADAEQEAAATDDGGHGNDWDMPD